MNNQTTRTTANPIMDARNDFLTARYAILEASRKAVCAIRAAGETHLDYDRLGHALEVDYANLNGCDRLIFELVADTAYNFLAAKPIVKHHRKPSMSPTARARLRA